MSTFSSAVQIDLRSELKKDKQLAFDVEFQNQRAKTWVFCLLWLFLGNLGAHRLYLQVKGRDEFMDGFQRDLKNGRSVFFWGTIGFLWSCILGLWGQSPEESANAFLILNGITFIHGIVVLCAGGIRKVNDLIAGRVARQIRSTTV